MKKLAFIAFTLLLFAVADINAQPAGVKKAANAVGEKSIAMLPLKELLPLTGYVHGGCSPIGMKKVFKTVFHKTAGDYDSIYFSGGKVGYQVKLRLSDLQDVLKYSLCDVV